MTFIAASPPWTPERDALVRQYWATTLTCIQIAHRIGGFEAFADKGRTSVSSRAKALGLPPRGPGVRKNHGYITTADCGLVHPYRPGVDPKPKLNY